MSDSEDGGSKLDPSLAPQPGVTYPIKVEYCKCGIPYEYCEYYPCFADCKRTLEESLPDLFAKLYAGQSSAGAAGAGAAGGADGGDKDSAGDKDAAEEGKKRQTRGGKGMVKAKKNKEKEAAKKITLSIAPRGKRKAVTVVQGLKTCGIDLKVASKFFGQRFACGSSITGDDEIVIQGDFKDELFDIIPEKWPEVDEDIIEDLGEKKR